VSSQGRQEHGTQLLGKRGEGSPLINTAHAA
jgi:hypothetical protein